MASGWEKFGYDVYDPSVSRNVFTDSEARSEYSRLRSAANSRLYRLEKAGFGDTAAFERAPLGGFPAASSLDKEELRNMLGEVGHFMSLSSTTVSGQKSAAAKMVSTMQEHGYTFINENNAQQFRRFMRAARQHYGDASKFDSERVVDAYERALDHPEIASPEEVQEDFDKWTEAEAWKSGEESENK